MSDKPVSRHLCPLSAGASQPEAGCAFDVGKRDPLVSYFIMLLPPRVGHYAVMTIVSVSPVPDPNSRTDGHSKLKMREAHDVN